MRTRKDYHWYWNVWRRNNPNKKMYYQAKNRAKRQNIVFNLQLEDIEIPTICPVLGIPLRIQGNRFYDSPSLDRIIPDKGYVKDNIKVISGRANILKRDATLDELEKLVYYMRKNS